MTTPRGIVVGIDRSPGSVHALDWALDEAVSREVPLTALLVWDASWMDAPEVSLTQDTTETIYQRIGARELARVQTIVDDARERLAARTPSARDHEIVAAQVQGSPVTSLLEQSADAELLVVGRRGFGTLAHLVMGSVSANVVHHAHRPVTVVPEPPRRPDASVPAGRHAAPATVVVGVDGSDSSVRALRYGAEVAARLDLDLDAVSCWNMPTLAPAVGGTAWVPPSSGLAAETEETLARTVDLAALSLPADRVHQVVLDASPAKGLITYARLAERLVVGSRGLGGFDRLVLGSTSSQVLRHTAGPVTVVPE
ncbi:universal stress protein [Sanguibacter antarcticus]|uniref:Nucleotide-binding universal stress UspA family protein n=1 Tax=Sanguibacter antarcticus TaxID=372484 RepID=A0A2A9E5P2_9MICO|nr:universal stress protein [Sanguibacter antarcticus]PFG34163.1 nucleotide-binding universal stress UspA family protein [Sanguibacter antarcticus]